MQFPEYLFPNPLILANTNTAFSLEGAGTTVVHPLGVLLLVACSAWAVFAPQRLAIIGFTALVCLLSHRQCIVLGGINLFFPRVLILLFFSLRFFVRPIIGFKWNRIDSTFVAYTITYILAGVIAYSGSIEVLKYRLGYAGEMAGTYFVIRACVSDKRSIEIAVRTLALFSFVLAIFFALEKFSGRNVFALFGGVPEFTPMRGGRLRCQGPFGHPILAGTFWASLIPIFAGFYLARKPNRSLYAFAIIASVLIVLFSASSTPLVGVLAGVVGWSIFPIRRFLAYIICGIGMLLLFLHMTMQSPVWSLIQRINITSGNSGYHRYILIDGFITHIHEWWIVGSIVGTAHWGHFTFDTANQFVAVGTSSGLLGLLLFLASILLATRSCLEASRFVPFLGWSFAVALFALTVSFIGISIWGQLIYLFGLLLAIPAAMSSGPKKGKLIIWARRRPSPSGPRSQTVVVKNLRAMLPDPCDIAPETR